MPGARFYMAGARFFMPGGKQAYFDQIRPPNIHAMLTLGIHHPYMYSADVVGNRVFEKL